MVLEGTTHSPVEKALFSLTDQILFHNFGRLIIFGAPRKVMGSTHAEIIRAQSLISGQGTLNSGSNTFFTVTSVNYLGMYYV
jgi:hypothetical protein